jgi:hypothetical protein
MVSSNEERERTNRRFDMIDFASASNGRVVLYSGDCVVADSNNIDVLANAVRQYGLEGSAKCSSSMDEDVAAYNLLQRAIEIA